MHRQMQLAAREEDYALASRLRDQMGPLTAQLHPMRQYLWGRVQTLHGAGSKQERLDAISALGAPSEDRAGGDERLSMYARRHAGSSARRHICLVSTPETRGGRVKDKRMPPCGATLTSSSFGWLVWLASCHSSDPGQEAMATDDTLWTSPEAARFATCVQVMRAMRS